MHIEKYTILKKYEKYMIILVWIQIKIKCIKYF